MVGRKSLDFASAEYQPAAQRERPGWARLWTVFSWCQLIAEQALALAVPIVGLYLLALCVAVAPLFLKKDSIAPVAFGSAAGFLAVAIGLIVYLFRHRISRGSVWPALLLVPGVAAGGLSWYLRHVTDETALVLVVGLAWVVSVSGMMTALKTFSANHK